MTQSEIEKMITLPENVSPSTVQKERLVNQWLEEVGWNHIPKDKTDVNETYKMAKEYYQQVYG